MAGTTEDAPAPWSGDLTLTIECRSARDARRGGRHPIVLHEDWSITTPHDLAAERVAMALGGYCSCVELVTATIPALRPRIGLIARTRRPSPRLDARGRWRAPADELSSCCSGIAYRSVRAVVAHLRSPAHLSHRLGLPPWQVDAVVRRIARACRPDLCDSAPAARHVRESGGLEHLWQAGIHPDDVPGMASHAAVVGGPLPTSYFEAVAYASDDPGWLADVLPHRPDADTAAWLAWRAAGADPAVLRELGPWLGHGIPRQDFLLAVDERLPPDAVPAVARATGWPVHAAARNVIEWARSGCRPTPEQFGVLARHGREYARPGATVLAAIEADLRHRGTPIARTELGVMLALAGTRSDLVAAVRAGARTARDVVALLAEGRAS